MDKPICQQCESQGKTYGVTLIGSFTNLMNIHLWWDPDGTQHSIGPTTYTSYGCTNGHRWQETFAPPDAGS